MFGYLLFITGVGLNDYFKMFSDAKLDKMVTLHVPIALSTGL